MYGEGFSTGTLAANLVGIAQDIRDMRDDGHPSDERMLEQCRNLMEGSMVLWETVMKESME